MTTGAEASELISIHLLKFPVELWARTGDESRDLMREFALISLEQHHHGVPHRLLELVTELQLSYGSIGADQEARLEEASRDGTEFLDEVIYQVPPRIERDIIRLGRILDEADDYCRAGEHLLSLASSPAAKAFRDWFLDEFCRQLGGLPATPWPESHFARELEAAGAGAGAE